MSEKASRGVQSVQRVFHLLETISRAGGEATLSDLAYASALPPATIHRLLRTLVSMGYARQLPNWQYALGARLIPIGEAASRQMGASARPRLATLARELGETANMAILDGDMATYIAQVPSEHSMRMFTEVGRRVHVHDSGVGKAILSRLDDAQARSIVARAGLPTPTHRSNDPVQDLLTELCKIRVRGYAVNDDEQEIGVRCLAVPLSGMPTPTAISVTGPATRVGDVFTERVVQLLLATARQIAADTNEHALDVGQPVRSDKDPFKPTGSGYWVRQPRTIVP